VPLEFLTLYSALAFINERHTALLRQSTHSVQPGVFTSNQVIYPTILTRRFCFSAEDDK